MLLLFNGYDNCHSPHPTFLTISPYLAQRSFLTSPSPRPHLPHLPHLPSHLGYQGSRTTVEMRQTENGEEEEEEEENGEDRFLYQSYDFSRQSFMLSYSLFFPRLSRFPCTLLSMNIWTLLKQSASLSCFCLTPFLGLLTCAWTGWTHITIWNRQ